MNKFKFNGVGQGLFYAGTLFNGTFNFVFDCGTSNKKSYIDRHINNYLHAISHGGGKPHIHLMVISHLHKDHFSGLLDLAGKAVIDKIYLPYLGENSNFIKFALAYAIFYNPDSGNDSMDNADNLALYSFMLRLYNVDDEIYNEVRLDIQRPEVLFVKSNKNRIGSNCLGESETICIKDLWQFELYQRSFDVDVLQDLLTRIGQHVPRFDSFSLMNFIRSSHKALETIAKEYEAVFGKKNQHKLNGGINISSIVMIHYPLYPDAYALIYNGNEDNTDIYTNSVVTVLTGDALDFDKYPRLIESIKDKSVLFFQVPHHGAEENWLSVKRAGFLKCEIEYYVIPFGLGNSYGHPNVNTLDSLIKSNKSFYNITQLGSLTYSIL